MAKTRRCGVEVVPHIICLPDCQPDLILFNHNAPTHFDGAHSHTSTHPQQQITGGTLDLTHSGGAHKQKKKQNSRVCVRACVQQKLRQSSRQCTAVSPGEVVGRKEVLRKDVDKEESRRKRLNKRSE